MLLLNTASQGNSCAILDATASISNVDSKQLSVADNKGFTDRILQAIQ